MARYQPSVSIAGYQIDCDWNGRPVVLADLEVDWGRDSLLDRADPAQAKVHVIDPVGDWASNPALYGAPLLITLPSGIQFRGKIDEVNLTPTDLDGEPVWEAEFLAVDVLAELAKRNPPGVPNQGGTFRYLELVQFGTGYWQQATSASRLTDLFPMCSDIITSITPPTPGTPTPILGARPRDDDANLLQLIVEAYQSQPLAWVTYVPGSGGIRPGFPTAPVGLALVYSGDVIRITAASGSVLLIDGCGVERDDDGTVTFSLADNIGTVEMSRRQYQTNSSYKVVIPTDANPNVTTEITTTTFKDNVVSTAAVAGPANAPNNVYRIDSTYKDDTYAAPGPWVDTYVGVVATALSKLNGRVDAPPMTFDLEDADYGAAVEAALLALVDTTVPIYITATEYTVLRTWGPQFQMIGAHLVFDQGWRITPKLAATGGTVTTPVTYANWVTNTVAEYRDFDPIIAYSDLANVSTGAA
jgi:hypothetical protein